MGWEARTFTTCQPKRNVPGRDNVREWFAGENTGRASVGRKKMQNKITLIAIALMFASALPALADDKKSAKKPATHEATSLDIEEVNKCVPDVDKPAVATDTSEHACPFGVGTYRGDKKSAWGQCQHHKCPDGLLYYAGQTCPAAAEPALASPHADITFTCTEGLTCDFDSSHSESPNGGIVSADWTFSDGTKDHGTKVTKTFAKPGSYTATVKVADGKAKTDSKTVPVMVVEKLAPAAQPPVARLVAHCEKMTCDFDGTGSTSEHALMKYNIHLGENEDVPAARAQKTYQKPGTYPATLTVTDGQGLTGTSSVQVTVPAPDNRVHEKKPLGLQNLHAFALGDAFGLGELFYPYLPVSKQVLRPPVAGGLDLQAGLGYIGDDWIFDGFAFGSPLMLEGAEDHNLNWQPYLSAVLGGGAAAQFRATDRFAIGPEVRGVFNAANIQSNLQSWISSVGVVVGPRATWSLFKWDYMKLDLVVSADVGGDYVYTHFADKKLIGRVTPMAEVSIGLGLSTVGPEKPDESLEEVPAREASNRLEPGGASDRIRR
jgi:PKD repeat protein